MSELKEGYTTGSCVAAAAKAGLRMLAGLDIPDIISVPFPPGATKNSKGRIEVPLKSSYRNGSKVRSAVIKDGGDDPDATHGAEIATEIELLAGEEPLSVELDGGTGVGRVTLPGLPVEVGQAAINPSPRAQILCSISEELQLIKKLCPSFPETGILRVTVEVPDGEKIAASTMNPQLGIIGGISILGTQGIVRPYSHESFKASISMGLDVAYACGYRHAVFTTGRRSQRLYSERHPQIPEQGIIQAADFFKYSMIEAAQKGFARVSWSLFFGKLVKHSQGFPYTHAKDWKIDFKLLAKWSDSCGFPDNINKEIQGANTARQVLQMIQEFPQAETLYTFLINKAQSSARKFCTEVSETTPQIDYALFDFDGTLLSKRD